MKWPTHIIKLKLRLRDPECIRHPQRPPFILLCGQYSFQMLPQLPLNVFLLLQLMWSNFHDEFLCNCFPPARPTHPYLFSSFTTVLPSNPFVPEDVDTLRACLLYLMLSFRLPQVINSKHLQKNTPYQPPSVLCRSWWFIPIFARLWEHNHGILGNQK